MRTIKPFSLTALSAPFQHNGKVRMVFVVGAMVDFAARKIEHEQALWKSLGDTPGASGSLDECKPKVRGEALASGYAYAPGGRPAPVVAARLSVGAINKDVWVVGDRVWKATGASEPVPFDRMPLGWDRAFGGEGYAPNPKGRGYAPLKTESGDSVHPLPNLEIPKKLVASPRDRPAPTAFGPVDPSWPQRMRKMGSNYDKKWLETRYPEVSDDFDPTFFNLASEDQWIDGYWQGGEAFVLENMHPDKPRLEGVVPALTARCFVTRVGVEDSFEEVGLRCDTLWFMPHKERMILVFRGGIDVADDEGADVVDVTVALERKGQPRPTSYYQGIRALRVEKKKGALYALRDMDLLPDDLEPVQSEALGEMYELLEREGLTESNMKNRAQKELDRSRAKLIQAGVDPDKYMPREIPLQPTKPRPLHELPDVYDDAMAQADKARLDAEGQRQQAVERAREIAKKAGVDLGAAADAKAPPGGPPKFRADTEIGRLRTLVAKAKAFGVNLPDNALRIEDPAFQAKLKLAEESAKDAYRKTAHYQPPAAALAPPDAVRVRRDVDATLGADASFAERDLTGADLAGVDFSGKDLSGIFLEKANLAGCSFRGANVERAVFARANLAGADFEGAKTAGANFGRADLTGAKLRGLDLSRGVFVGATLKEADFTGSTLDNAELSEAVCERTIFAKVHARGLTVLRADLRGLDLREAQITESNFLDVNLDGADFSGASLFRTAFLDTTAEGARFENAKLDKFRVVKSEKGSSLARAQFRGATLKGANLRGVNLEGADLRETDLSQADLSGCNLRGADLEGARGPEIRLVKADLTDANLARTDFMYALLGNANVRGASFEEANVFRADGAKMKGDDRTSFKGANVKQVRVVPDRSGNG
jgi:uncharacterized protein YjbI with pentapeptide repeats